MIPSCMLFFAISIHPGEKETRRSAAIVLEALLITPSCSETADPTTGIADQPDEKRAAEQHPNELRPTPSIRVLYRFLPPRPRSPCLVPCNRATVEGPQVTETHVAIRTFKLTDPTWRIMGLSK